jgi:hypothetical protein
MDKCPKKKECRFPPSHECKTATDWVYNYMCNDEDYFLDANCDEGILRLKCVNGEGDETGDFRYYDPDVVVEGKRELGRKNSQLSKSLRGRLKPKKSKRKKKKKKQTKRKKR